MERLLVFDMVLIRLFVPALLVLIEADVVIPSFHINLTLSREVAERGEDLKAYCHVNRTSSDVDVIPVVEKKKNYQVIWFKILPESGGEEVEIATNDYLNEEFQETGRFTADLQMLNPGDISSVEFSLYLNNLQPADSGYLGCRIGLPSVNLERFTQLTVQVPAQSVWWSSPSSSSDGQLLWTVYKPNENLSFSEGELCHFTCTVNGSYPRPVVKVFIGSEDLTQYFTSSAVLIKGHGVRGLQPIYYRVELSNRSLNIDYRYNDKQLKCVANLPDADPALAISSTVFIRLTVFRPKFFCSRRVVVHLDERNFKLTCTVRAKPGVSHASFFRNGTLLTNNMNNNNNNNNNNNYNNNNNNNNSISGLDNETATIIYVKETSPAETVMVLTIGRVLANHLGLYLLEAENEFGTQQHEIELYDPERSDHLKSIADSTSSSGCGLNRPLLILQFIIIIVIVIKNYVQGSEDAQRSIIHAIINRLDNSSSRGSSRGRGSSSSSNSLTKA